MECTILQKLFQPGGALESLVIKLPIPNTVSDLSPKGIALRLDLIGATGTAILLTVIITILITKLKWKSAGALLVEAIKELWLPILTISAILAIAKVMTYGGLTVAIGQGIAKAEQFSHYSLSIRLDWCVYDWFSCK